MVTYYVFGFILLALVMFIVFSFLLDLLRCSPFPSFMSMGLSQVGIQ